jgi:hypothetical protein
MKVDNYGHCTPDGKAFAKEAAEAEFCYMLRYSDYYPLAFVTGTNACQIAPCGHLCNLAQAFCCECTTDGFKVSCRMCVLSETT